MNTITIRTPRSAIRTATGRSIGGYDAPTRPGRWALRLLDGRSRERTAQFKGLFDGAFLIKLGAL